MRIATCCILSGLVVVAAVGCRQRQPAATATQPAQQLSGLGPTADPNADLVLPGSPTGSTFLDVYQVSLPMGAFSRNDEVWVRIDEEKISPTTKDLLQKNGFRAGLAANHDWDFFRDQIEQNPHFARSGSAAASTSGFVELPLKENVDEQTVFFLPAAGREYGRTYEKCSNFLGISFWADPRKRGMMRVSFSPVVRATRVQRTFTVRGEERYFTDVTPEFLYELNLRLDIPADRFLVLGLSRHGDRESSLGHQFLVMQGGAELREQFLVFVPRLASRRAPAATQRTPDLDAGKKPVQQ